MDTPQRGMREWMRTIERKVNNIGRGVHGIVASAVDSAKGEIRDEVVELQNRHPTAPIELTYQTAFYLGLQNRRRVRFILDFPDVVKSTDGYDLVMQGYELWGYERTPSALAQTVAAYPGIAAPGLSLPGATQQAVEEGEQVHAAEGDPVFRLVASSTSSSFRVDDFTPGSLWTFKARAIGASTSVPGEFSKELNVTMEADKTAPTQPTVPTITVSRGTITVTWDGQSVNGAMPADFKFARLAHGQDSSPTREVHKFGRGGGIWVLADIEYYDVQFFRIQAVDESGNESPWSEQAFGFTTPLVDKDIILSTLDAAETHLKNIDAGVSILPNTIISEHLVVTKELTARIGNFLTVNADNINANSIWADEAFFGLADAKLVRSDMFIGKEFFGGTFTGGTFQTTVEEYKGVQFDDDGIVGYAPTGGVETFRLSTADGSLTASRGTLTGMLFQTDVLPDRGLKMNSAGLWAFDPQTGQRTFQWNASDGSLFAWKGYLTGMVFQTDGAGGVGMKMGPYGIRGYANGETTLSWDINDGSLVARKGSLTGMSFQTSILANTGAKMDANGLRYYDSAGRLRLSATPNGSTFTGRVVSGFDPNLQAVLADQVFQSQPGVQFNVGGGFNYQPFVTGWASDNNFASGRGMLHMSSARTGGSYADIYLSENGIFNIRGTGAHIFGAGGTDGVSRQLRMSAGVAQVNLQEDIIAMGFTNGGASVSARANDTIGLSGNTTTFGNHDIQGNFTVAGSKNFMIPHPTKPGMSLLHGSTESPVSGIEYWGCGTIDASDSDTFELPEYFEALAKPDNRIVMVTGNGVALAWSDIIDGRVTVWGPEGTDYTWLVKAERFGGDFEPERVVIEKVAPTLEELVSDPA